MDQQIYDRLLEQLRMSVAPALGCTEPVSIALNTALARKHARGDIRALTVTMDGYLYKNAMGVGIPGADERGCALCAALGVVAGDPDKGMLVLEDVSPEALSEAKDLARRAVVTRMCEEAQGLYIESILETDIDCVRVITRNRHDGIVLIEHAPFSRVTWQQGDAEAPVVRPNDLREIIAFADDIDLEALCFLREGIEMNRRIADAGYEIGLGKALSTLIDKGVIGKSCVSRAELMCASASYARMSGVPLPVMTATGSGNQGITLLLTIEAVAQEMNISDEKKLRAAALAGLVNIYVKSYIGALSAVCACGVSSGLAASVGIVYMLGGDERMMLDAMKNVLGSISGMICDGAKEGCANKVELSSGLAVMSALLALHGASIVERDGILGCDLEELFQNLGQLIKEGMNPANRVIVDIMSNKRPSGA